jgi:hypothetical protein
MVVYVSHGIGKWFVAGAEVPGAHFPKLIQGPYAFTAAGAIEAPFIDLDRIDIFLLPDKSDAKLRQIGKRRVSETAPRLRFIYPYAGFICSWRARPEAGRLPARQCHRETL